jgi:CheY-like chemotaxis protein
VLSAEGTGRGAGGERTMIELQKTVLIAEDDAWTRALLTAILAEEGYAVMEAANGAEAIRMAKKHEPLVLLLDLALPRKSGLDVLWELKSDEATRDIPVIVVSGYALLLPADDASLADCVIQKPFDLADLLVRVDQAASKRLATGGSTQSTSL